MHSGNPKAVPVEFESCTTKADPEMSQIFLDPPATDEANEFYWTYIRLVPPGNLFELAEVQNQEVRDFFRQVTDEQASEVHSPYKWTIKQVVGHMIDTERIFADRLHRFACGEHQSLPGMDQEPYVASCDYATPTIESLVDELCCLRSANVSLMRRLKKSQWDLRGIASGQSVTVRALGFMLVGHVTYHMQIIKKRLA